MLRSARREAIRDTARSFDMKRAIVTCLAGVRSEHGVTDSWKLIAVIHRRESVPRDPSDGIESDGACRDDRRRSRVLLAARAKSTSGEQFPAMRSGRDERVTNERWTDRSTAGLKTGRYLS